MYEPSLNEKLHDIAEYLGKKDALFCMKRYIYKDKKIKIIWTKNHSSEVNLKIGWFSWARVYFDDFVTKYLTVHKPGKWEQYIDLLYKKATLLREYRLATYRKECRYNFEPIDDSKLFQ